MLRGTLQTGLLPERSDTPRPTCPVTAIKKMPPQACPQAILMGVK